MHVANKQKLLNVSMASLGIRCQLILSYGTAIVGRAMDRLGWKTLRDMGRRTLHWTLNLYALMAASDGALSRASRG